MTNEENDRPKNSRANTTRITKRRELLDHSEDMRHTTGGDSQVMLFEEPHTVHVSKKKSVGGATCVASSTWMNILAWNCRGTEGSRKKQFMIDLLRSTRAEIAFVMKSSEAKSNWYLRDLPLPNSTFVPARGLSRGLWLLWGSQARLQVIK